MLFQDMLLTHGKPDCVVYIQLRDNACLPLRVRLLRLVREGTPSIARSTGYMQAAHAIDLQHLKKMVRHDVGSNRNTIEFSWSLPARLPAHQCNRGRLRLFSYARNRRTWERGKNPQQGGRTRNVEVFPKIQR